MRGKVKLPGLVGENVRQVRPECLMARYLTAYTILILAGIIISGGYSPGDLDPLNTTELWIPSTGVRCRLVDLPERTAGHSYSDGLVCGGVGRGRVGRNSCVKWTGRSWRTWVVLDTIRLGHTAWNSSSGVVLMGNMTAEIIKGEDRMEKYFDMKYQTR